MACEVDMEKHSSSQDYQPKDVGHSEVSKQNSNGFAWWRPRSILRASLADVSLSTTNTSVVSNSNSNSNSSPPLPHQGGGEGEGEGESSPSSLFDVAAAAQQQQFETQLKPKIQHHSNWTRGSRDGTEAPSPDEDDATNNHHNDADSATAASPSLLPAYNNDSARRRRPEQGLLGSSSGKLKSLKLAPIGSEQLAKHTAAAAAVDSDRPGTPVRGGGIGSTWCVGPLQVRRQEQQDEQQRRRLDEQRRTPSKPPRTNHHAGAVGARFAVASEGGMGTLGEKATAQAGVGEGSWREEGMDDETAAEEGGQVAAERMRALTSGQGEFLARRGFAAGLVSHFLEETNCEFRVLQGGASCGMNAQQLEDAAARLEEVFVPAVKRLRARSSVDVVLDSLFQGADDAGDFVVRFEVTLTRCHPEDIDSSPAPALRECASAIKEAVRDEGVNDKDTHEVVFVGRPMWELVSPVLDLSAKAGGGAGASG
ncbi:hypothetical protein Esi_0013_0117 [Ectocarpus siliculosus]|uniref:Uncharacterized protein n=1 Tax=Ectocarpus siliculosus TaxID=2880 RepID=D8LEB0_ECTSI|nr:hypothetical protein Esi_0013_0117 [Ectocarpus siliculosus]|eukprot:CBN74195.1 hypothetical protein Esi_0013_0117 [Ectocarpus siliculosus]